MVIVHLHKWAFVKNLKFKIISYLHHDAFFNQLNIQIKLIQASIFYIAASPVLLPNCQSLLAQSNPSAQFTAMLFSTVPLSYLDTEPPSWRNQEPKHVMCNRTLNFVIMTGKLHHLTACHRLQIPITGSLFGHLDIDHWLFTELVTPTAWSSYYNSNLLSHFFPPTHLSFIHFIHSFLSNNCPRIT